MLNTLCTLAAIALAIFSLSQAYAEVNRPALDTVITGSTAAPASAAAQSAAAMPSRPGF